MKRALRLSLAVFVREAGFVAHDRNLLMVMLAGVLLYPLLYGTLYIQKREREVPVVIVDEDHSESSRQLMRAIDAHPMLRVREQLSGESAARDRIFRMQAVAAVTIPEGYDELQGQKRTAPLVAHLDASRFLGANDVNVALNEVVAELGRTQRIRAMQSAGMSAEQAISTADPLKEDIRALYNPTESYGNFLTPAIFMLILLHTLLIGLAEGMGKERETGRIRDLRTAAEGSIGAMVAGKGAFYVLLYGAHALFFFAVFFPLYGQAQRGGWLPLALLFILTLTAYVCWGILWGSLFKRKITGFQITVLTSYPLFLLSGYSWPSFAMPKVLQALAMALPSTPFLQAMGRVTQMGADTAQIGGEVLHLMILCVVGYAAVYWRLKTLLPVTDRDAE